MQPAAAFARLPETLTVPEIGAEMARLRAQFGLTPQEVSERLHIRPRYIHAIEEGKFELMPGKVYARGYVQTYAEFLGLDPEQLAQLCFAGEGAVAAITQHRAPPSVRPTMPLDAGRFRGIGIVAVLLMLAIGISQWVGSSGINSEETSVAPVPENMLSSVRTRMMPMPNNKDCLTTDALLACYFADNATRDLMAMLRNPFAFGAPIDMSELELVPLEQTDAESGASTGDEENAVENAAPAESVAEAPND